ncbi:MAG: patatin-like phospholipase family protein, partial [Candidatus Omnitrophica bacterium]|nr:patatin-like phospholipase family protein [Candidatus Omnitrophota bacterium]
ELQKQGEKVAAFSINKDLTTKSINNKTIKTSEQINFIDKYVSQKDIVILDIGKELTAVEQQILTQTDSCHLLATEGEEEKLVQQLLENGLIRENILTVNTHRISQGRVQSIARNLTGKAIGLALGCGGALALSQIGVLEILEKEKVDIDMIAGTSMGAIISSFWAVGYKAKQIQESFQDFNSQKKTLSFFDFALSHRGFVKGKNIKAFLKKYLGEKTFADTNIPLKIIACDIETRKEVVLDKGKIADAVMASIAIPGIINPVQAQNGQMLVDGGIINPLPVSVLSKEGIKRIIAVNCMPSPEDKIKNISNNQMVIDVMINSFYSMQYMIGKHVGEYVDLYLHPVLQNSAWHEFFRVNEFVECGRESVCKKIKELRELQK